MCIKSTFSYASYIATKSSIIKAPKNYLFEANTLEAYIYEITFSIKLRMNKYQSLIYIHSSFAKKKTNIHSFHYLQSQYPRNMLSDHLFLHKSIITCQSQAGLIFFQHSAHAHVSKCNAL